MDKIIEIQTQSDDTFRASTDIERSIFDLDTQIEMLSSHADNLDCYVAIASGVLCGMMDILWVGNFDLSDGKQISDSKVDDFVKKTAKMMGCKNGEIKASVKYLEQMFPIPSDGNTPDFGGGLQHHLRDFGHHPTIVGLMFSLLTQFTEKSYGTDTLGNFMIVPVPEKSKIFIGTDITDKLVKGTLIWFFHLVSDIAGSSSTAGLGGGTGIPGPILAMAKELSVLPFFKNMNVQGISLSEFLSKLFNGTLLAKHDENGKIIKDTIIKFDLRGEMGASLEAGKQAIPVIANECIVRSLFFIRRFAIQIKQNRIHSIHEFAKLDWKKMKPSNNATLTRMLTISSGVFTTLDITEAVITQKYWVSVNYVGMGRFAMAIGRETANCLKKHNVKKIKKMYEDINRNTLTTSSNVIYKRMETDMNFDKLGLTLEQTEILYNLELLKTLNDISVTGLHVDKNKVIQLKQQWIDEWKNYMESGFEAFTQIKGAKLHWFDKASLITKIESLNPKGTWFRLVLLEAMLFEPYFALSLEKDKKGNSIPSKKYEKLGLPLVGYKEAEGDKYLENFFNGGYYQPGYIKRLRKCYGKVMWELNEVLKTVLTTVTLTAVITIIAVATAGALAPTIAVALVGSNFAGLSGAALTSACLAYIGGGAIAAGGLGMAGGTLFIVGGGAVLGLGVGAGVGGAAGVASIMGKKATILQSAKLMVSMREIFLNDEHDIEYSNTIYEQYVKTIMEIEKGVVELELKAETADKKEKKALKAEIKNAEESVNVMKVAMKSMNRFKSSFETGLGV